MSLVILQSEEAGKLLASSKEVYLMDSNRDPFLQVASENEDTWVTKKLTERKNERRKNDSPLLTTEKRQPTSVVQIDLPLITTESNKKVRLQTWVNQQIRLLSEEYTLVSSLIIEPFKKLKPRQNKRTRTRIRPRISRLKLDKAARNLNTFYQKVNQVRNFLTEESRKRWHAYLQSADVELHSLNRSVESLLIKLRQLEDEIILKYFDGIESMLGIELVEDGRFIRDVETDWEFQISQIQSGAESNNVMNVLYDAECPVQRIDKGIMGSAAVNSYRKWMQNQVRLHGAPRPGLLEGLDYIINQISSEQLAWESLLIYPPELMPHYVEQFLSPLGKKEVHEYLLGLFRPLTDFNKEEWAKFIINIGLGSDPLNAIVTKNLKPIDQLLETSKVQWHLFQLDSLGIYPTSGSGVDFRTTPVEAWLGSDFIPVELRSIAELRRQLLPLIERQGEEIRLITTLMPVHPKRRQGIRKQQKSLSDSIARKLKDHKDEVTIEEKYKMMAILKGLQETAPARSRSFNINTILAVKGPKEISTSYLSQQLETYLGQSLFEYGEGPVVYTLPQDRVDSRKIFKALLPTIRYAQTGKNTRLLPGTLAKQIFRPSAQIAFEHGSLAGRILEKFDEDYPEVETVDEVFGVKTGGNAVYVGAPGSGKSMLAKLIVDRMIGINKNWFARIMDNTSLEVSDVGLLRGWRNLVLAYDGIIVDAREFDKKYGKEERAIKLERFLDKMTTWKIRIILFLAKDDLPDLDKVWLDWIIRDVSANPGGIFAVDETANWFVEKDDTRGRDYANKVLNQLAKCKYMGITTIQTLGSIWASPVHRATFETIMTNATAGVYAFWTGNIGSVARDLNIPDAPKSRPLIDYITQKMKQLKKDPTGPIDMPGYAILYTPGRAWFIKVEADKKTLEFLARILPREVDTENIWGE